MRKISLILVVLIVAAAAFFTFRAMRPVYKRASAPVEERVRDLVTRMTLEEKVHFLGGTGFTTQPVERLGIPALKMADGPVGVRFEKSTAFPSGLSMAASFNRALIRRVSGAMAVETRAHGRDMLLGPCVGHTRVPVGGRNFEGLGEDPFLAAEITGWYVKGLNEHGVVGSVKHFALNDQEYERTSVNSLADERVMHEIHLPPFERAVEEGVGSVMSSYNLVNGKHASENEYLLSEVLKKRWGFKGFVVSDWVSTHSTVDAAKAGLDLEMPEAEWFGPKLLAAVKSGEISEELINDKVSRILRVIIGAGLLDGRDAERPPASAINSREHQQLALQLAREGHVLLKNDNSALPFDRSTIKRIAVIGPNANKARTGGGGSSMVVPPYAVSILDGIRNRAGKIDVGYAVGTRLPNDTAAIDSGFFIPAKGGGTGLHAEYFANKELKGEPVITRTDAQIDFLWPEGESPGQGVPQDGFSARWTGKLRPRSTGMYELSTLADDGVRLWVGDKLVIDDWKDHWANLSTGKVKLEAGQTYDMRLEYYENGGGAIIRFGWMSNSEEDLREAVKLAAESDVAVVAAGFSDWLEGEGHDRETFALTKGQDELIEAVTKANPRTVVVVTSGNPFDMNRWLNKVPAVIYTSYAGQEAGNALADVLFGDYNPSGRLPFSMLKRWEDSPAYGTYPQTNGEVRYKEGLFTGYRYFDRAKVKPHFPFGHGLSYTKFEYSGLKLAAQNDLAPDAKVTAEVTVKNSGARPGSEVVQLYVHPLAPPVERPLQELKGFEKIELQPGESKTVSFQLNPRSFAHFDPTSKNWTVGSGEYELRVGASSQDIRQSGNIVLR